MSVAIEQLQKRLGDLKFSLEETVKELNREQDQSENDHSAWEDEGKGLEGDAAADHAADEPDVIDNETKVNACEKAQDHIDEAIEALDAALED